MNSAMRSWVCGVGVGAGVTFLLDPGRGARRRALIRDKFVRAGRKTRDAIDATQRDVGNRVSGLVAETRAMLSNDTADDRVICARVRAELGRVASHPRAIRVKADDGVVTLVGDVLASEMPRVVSAAESARGVKTVRNQLTPHASVEGVPSLQGTSERPGQWSTWLRQGWSPTAMLVVGAAAAAATALAGVSMRRAA
jgi:hypothetical protein